jgi:hypothetical protein
MRFFTPSLIVLSCVVALGCSSSSDNGPSGTTDSGTAHDTGTGGGDTGTTTTDSGTSSDTPSEGGGNFTLKVENYLSWCNVGVNGGAAKSDAVQTISVPAGTVVNLHADALNSTFVWGYWRGTAGNTGAAHDKSQTTTVTVDADNKVVQACCPFATDPSTPCGDPTP